MGGVGKLIGCWGNTPFGENSLFTRGYNITLSYN